MLSTALRLDLLRLLDFCTDGAFLVDEVPTRNKFEGHTVAYIAELQTGQLGDCEVVNFVGVVEQDAVNLAVEGPQVQELDEGEDHPDLETVKYESALVFLHLDSVLHSEQQSVFLNSQVNEFYDVLFF